MSPPYGACKMRVMLRGDSAPSDALPYSPFMSSERSALYALLCSAQSLAVPLTSRQLSKL